MKYTVFSQGALQTNCTVLEKGQSCVVVDIAYGSEQLENYVLSHNLKVQAILLTHGHFDHCGGVRHFLNRCACEGVPVLVHKNDLQLCQNADKNIWRIPCESCEPTDFVSEGSLTLGDFSFTVLETFGHTGGSVVYIAENLMLSGDTLFCGGIGRTDFAESKPELIKQSLQKLCTLDGDYVVVCGHGEATTLKYEKQHNNYLYEVIH